MANTLVTNKKVYFLSYAATARTALRWIIITGGHCYWHSK